MVNDESCWVDVVHCRIDAVRCVEMAWVVVVVSIPEHGHVIVKGVHLLEGQFGHRCSVVKQISNMLSCFRFNP